MTSISHPKYPIDKREGKGNYELLTFDT